MFDFVSKHLGAVDGVVFDFGGVIVAMPDDDWPIYGFCERHGLPREKTKAGIAKYRRSADNGDISIADIYRFAFRDAGLAEPYPGFGDDAAAIDSEGFTRFLPETLALIRELKALGRKIGLLSNMSELFYKEYYLRRAAHIRALLDAEAISSNHRLSKPDRAIYDLAARMMGLPPERLLFLDDTPANVEAARAYGWRAEVYALPRAGNA